MKTSVCLIIDLICCDPVFKSQSWLTEQLTTCQNIWKKVTFKISVEQNLCKEMYSWSPYLLKISFAMLALALQPTEVSPARLCVCSILFTYSKDLCPSLFCAWRYVSPWGRSSLNTSAQELVVFVLMRAHKHHQPKQDPSDIRGTTVPKMKITSGCRQSKDSGRTRKARHLNLCDKQNSNEKRWGLMRRVPENTRCRKSDSAKTGTNPECLLSGGRDIEACKHKD